MKNICKSIYDHEWGYNAVGGIVGHGFSHTTGEQICMKCRKTFKEVIYHFMKKQERRVIDYISLNQGWEESGDVYRRHFGIPTQYDKLSKIK